MRTPCRNWNKGWEVYLGVCGVLLLPLLLAVRVCSVCKGEEGRLKGLCLLHVFHELGLYDGFL